MAKLFHDFMQKEIACIHVIRSITIENAMNKVASTMDVTFYAPARTRGLIMRLDMNLGRNKRGDHEAMQGIDSKLMELITLL